MRHLSALATMMAFVCAVATARGQGDPSQGTLPTPTAPASSAPTQPAVSTTRATSFEMPFSVDQMNAAVVSVELYVSTNRGANWQLHSRQAPSAGRFHFRASGDGEYWFASRTIDARGRSFPEGPLRAEQMVIVDTTQPQVEFEAKVGEAGEVQAEWTVYDPSLDARTLRLEYQAGAGQPWQPIAIEVPRDDAGRRNLSGRTSWWPPEAGSTLNVRVEVRDRAENATVVVRQVALPRIARREPATNAVANSPPQDPNAWRPVPSVGATAWPSDNLPPADTAANLAATQGSPNQSDSRPSTYSDSSSTRSVPAIPASRPQADTPTRLGSLPTQPAVTDRIRPGVADQATPSPTPAASATTSLPKGVRPQMTNVNRFNLDYDVDAVGPNGVADVELWATTDGGRTWTRWGRDPDRKSPFDVAVDRDGVYGFSIVVIGQSGLASRPPAPGDLADLWIGIDTTAPQAKLVSATYGEGSQVGKLLIRWQADDAGLVERPVTLSFSDRPNGSWTTIAAGLPNNGQYNWPADPRLPDKIYLRIEVRDEAGNVGVDRLAEPIDVQGLTPRGHIRGFRPAAEEARRRPPTSQQR